MATTNNFNMLDIKSAFDHTFGNEVHDKRKLSLSYAALGVLESESLILHKIGAGMAKARGVDKKHATKQVDRLLSNPAYDIWDLSSIWVPHVIGCKKEVMVLKTEEDVVSDMAQNKCKDVEKYLNKEINYLHELIKKANGKQ